MTRKSSHFRHESLQDSKAIVRYLDALSEGFEKGTLQFRDQEGEIVLEPSGMIRFEVTASRKSGRYSVALKLSWKQAEEQRRDSGPLLINGEAERAEDDEPSARQPPPPPVTSASEADSDTASSDATARQSERSKEKRPKAGKKTAKTKAAKPKAAKPKTANAKK